MPTINDYSPVFAADQQRRSLSAALAEGAEAFRRDGRDGGPQSWIWPGPFDMERPIIGRQTNKTKWDLKLKALRLANVWRESVQAAASLPFDVEATISGWSPAVEAAAGRIDDLGNSITQHWAEQFFWKLVHGVQYTLVEAPEAGGDPYWIIVLAPQVRDIVARRLADGRLVADEARLYMPRQIGAPADDPEDWQPAKVVERVRIYRTAERMNARGDTVAADGPVHFRHAELTERRGWAWSDEWAPIEARAGVLREIPLAPWFGRRAGPFRGWPRFGDAADDQAALIRSVMAYDAREDNDARNFVVFAGVTASQVQTLPSGAVVLEGEGAAAQLMETTGAALKALRDGQEARKESIRAACLRPLLTRPQPMTATEIKVREIGAASELEQSILADIGTLTALLTWHSQLAGSETIGGVTMPHDFSQDSAAIEKIWEGWLQGGGRPPTEWVFREAQRAGWVHESEDPQELATAADAAELRANQAGGVA